MFTSKSFFDCADFDPVCLVQCLFILQFGNKLSFQEAEENYLTVLCGRWHKDGVEKDSKLVAIYAAGVLYLPYF